MSLVTGSKTSQSRRRTRRSSILAKLHTFRGASRFTRWAYKFVLLEAGVKARRRAWHGREVSLDAESWPLVADGSAATDEAVEDIELLGAIRDAVHTKLHDARRKLRAAPADGGHAREDRGYAGGRA
jgi:RNA polymerase sigma-70 factor (ECF subfamily)